MLKVLGVVFLLVCIFMIMSDRRNPTPYWPETRASFDRHVMAPLVSYCADTVETFGASWRWCAVKGYEAAAQEGHVKPALNQR